MSFCDAKFEYSTKSCKWALPQYPCRMVCMGCVRHFGFVLFQAARRPLSFGRCVVTSICSGGVECLHLNTMNSSLLELWLLCCLIDCSVSESAQWFPTTVMWSTHRLACTTCTCKLTCTQDRVKTINNSTWMACKLHQCKAFIICHCAYCSRPDESNIPPRNQGNNSKFRNCWSLFIVWTGTNVLWRNVDPSSICRPSLLRTDSSDFGTT